MRVLAAYEPHAAEGPAVLEAAIEEARLRGAELLVVRHVKRERAHPLPIVPGESPAGETPTRDESGEELARLRDHMRALEQRVSSRGVPCEAILLDEGDSHAEPILRLAEEGDVDLIVVGIRRRSRVGKALLGSDAQTILLHAPCAVLGVKSDDDNW